MKRKFHGILSLSLALLLSLCLLTACGGEDGENAGQPDAGPASDAGDASQAESIELAGTAWEVDGIVYHFFDDGVAATDTGYIISYTWDGNQGEAYDEDVRLEIIYDEDGLFIEGEDGNYYELTPAGEADLSLLGDDEEGSGGTLELEGTAWEMENGNALHFFAGGVAATSDGGVLSYTWDGSSGEITDGSASLEMVYDEDGFFVEMNDETFHQFTYAGEADASLLEDDDDDDGEVLSGSYDNDEVETSMIFHGDGTCTISTLYEETVGVYTVDGDGYLYIETDTGSAEGYYDSSDDTFTLNGVEGHFYFVSSPYYTP